MESKRRNLIDAAKTLLWETGYESMSPRRVLATSGAGQGSMYHHFTGKEDLAATALDETTSEMIAAFDALFDDALPPLARIARYLELERDGTARCRLGRLANERAVQEGPLRLPLERYFEHVERRITKALKEAAKDGALGDGVKPRKTAAALVAAVQGGYVLSLAHNDPGYVGRATSGALALLKAAAP
ncbi:MAG: TetR/AcrR family transcriptional regulator [Rhodobacterales bacterium]|nr:TetR/AcrR family transcriptional regulator [Rhodobacterales bacterium]